MQKSNNNKLDSLYELYDFIINDYINLYENTNEFEALKELYNTPKSITEFLSGYSKDDMSALPSLIAYMEKNHIENVCKQELAKIIEYKDSEGSPHIIELYKKSRKNLLFSYLLIWSESLYSKKPIEPIIDLLKYDTENLNFYDINCFYNMNLFHLICGNEVLVSDIDEEVYSRFSEKLSSIIDANKTRLSKTLLIENYFFKKEEYFDIFLSKIAKSDNYSITAIEGMMASLVSIIWLDNIDNSVDAALEFINRKFNTANKPAKKLLAQIANRYLKRSEVILTGSTVTNTVNNIIASNKYIPIRDLSMTVLFHLFNNNFKGYKQTTITEHANYIIQTLLDTVRVSDISGDETSSNRFTQKMLSFVEKNTVHPLSHHKGLLRTLQPKSAVVKWLVNRYVKESMTSLRHDLESSLGYNTDDIIKVNININIDDKAIDLLNEVNNN